MKTDLWDDEYTPGGYSEPGYDFPPAEGASSYTVVKPKTKKALSDMQSAPYVVLDVETTGFSPTNDRIIELGMLYCENGRFERYSSLFNPGVRISRNIENITGITNQDVAAAPAIEDCLSDILSFIGDTPIVAHNAHFDAKFLVNALNRAGFSEQFVFYDTLEMSRRAWPDMPDHKLDTLIAELSLAPARQSHRALNDAICTQRLFDLCVDQLLERREAELAAKRSQRNKKYCKHCGRLIDEDCVVCPLCGKQVEALKAEGPQVVINNANTNTNFNRAAAVNSVCGYGRPRNKWTAFFLCLLFGYFGAHKFYDGKAGMGILYLCTLGLCGIGWVIDLLAILARPNPYYI